MPGHYRSPYGYSYFNPTGKEQAALTIGSLLAGALAASSGQSKGDAIRKGITGTMAGYGSGYKNYQELMGDAFTRDLQGKSYGQRVKEYEESEKPYRESATKENEARANYYNQRESIPIDYNKIRDERVKRRLGIRLQQEKLKESVKTPDDYLKEISEIETQIAKLRNTSSADIDSVDLALNTLNQRRAGIQRKIDVLEGKPLYTDPIIKEGIKSMFIPPQTQPQLSNQGMTQITLDEKTAMQFLNQAGGDRNKARELARQAGYEF